MQIASCPRRSVKVGAWINVRALNDMAFDPDLSGTMILPIGKETDTVTTGKNIVEVIFELREREILIDHLGHLEGRLHVEGDPCDHTKGSKSDHDAWKFVAQFFAGEDQNISACGN